MVALPMTNNGLIHPLRNVFPQQSNGVIYQPLNASVMQDKARKFSARPVSPQPAVVTKFTRAGPLNNPSVHLPNPATTKQPAVQLTLWVKPIVKAELQRIAQQEGLSLSATGSAFLEKALQQHIDLNYSPLLQPIIEMAIQKQMRSISTRLAWLLVRVAFDTGQTRSLVTNILGRQPGVTQEVLKTLLQMSSQTAKGNLIRKTPQLKALMEAVEQWLVGHGEEQERGS